MASRTEVEFVFKCVFISNGGYRTSSSMHPYHTGICGRVDDVSKHNDATCNNCERHR